TSCSQSNALSQADGPDVRSRHMSGGGIGATSRGSTLGDVGGGTAGFSGARDAGGIAAAGGTTGGGVTAGRGIGAGGSGGGATGSRAANGGTGGSTIGGAAALFNSVRRRLRSSMVSF